jgi:hypothetical protein
MLLLESMMAGLVNFDLTTKTSEG